MIKNFNEVLNLIINTNGTVLIAPLVLLLLPFIKSNHFKNKEFNDDYLSISQTKIIKGFCALGIIFHHLSQKTASSWLNTKYIVHGLDFFVDIGYLFIGTFLFISGYGLYKSLKVKENYLDNFFLKRILPILLAYLTINLIYYFYNTIPSTYNWYIAGIVYSYILFCLSFKNIKNENISFLIVSLGLLLYCIFCNFFMLGGWWYNTIFLFELGLLYSKYETIIIKFIKKYYVPLLMITIFITIVCRYYGRHYEIVIYNVTKESIYDLYSFYIILFRFLASSFFTLLIILTSLKFKYNSKILSFYGGISLEFYLIQGLFVQMFGYCYFNNDIKPLYYIRNVALYSIVVLSLSTISAFIMNFINRKIMEFIYYFIEKRKSEINYVLRALKKILLIGFGCIALYVLVYSVINVYQSRNDKKYINEYVEKYIQFVNVNGKKMAAYIVGEGDNTLVLMRGNNDPCPTLSLKYFADYLSNKYKVVVIDYAGTGFSDKPSSDRTSKNIAYELHETLQGLGIKENYILVPEYISGLYAQEYVKNYSNEVKAVIAMEALNQPLDKAIADYSGISQIELHKSRKTKSIMNYCVGRLANISGLDMFVWETFRELYMRGLSTEEMIVAKDIVLKNLYNSTYLNEVSCEYENYRKSISTQYPRSTYVIDVLGYYSNHELIRMGIFSEECHLKVCFDRSKHKTIEANDIGKIFFMAPGIFDKLVNKSLDFIK